MEDEISLPEPTELDLEFVEPIDLGDGNLITSEMIRAAAGVIVWHEQWVDNPFAIARKALSAAMGVRNGQ